MLSLPARAAVLRQVLVRAGERGDEVHATAPRLPRGGGPGRAGQGARRRAQLPSVRGGRPAELAGVRSDEPPVMMMTGGVGA